MSNLIIHPHFDMPQLGRKRTIRVLLPRNYEKRSKHQFPVIYLQDGQNLFEASTAAFRHWRLQEFMARQPAKRQAILVGIDNAERNRIREYSPTIRGHRLGRGDVKSQGHAYLEFIEQSLKPFIDETYRTKPDREFTGIVGSSMGGLIAFYAGLRFSHVFGKVGVLSPSLWHDSKWHEWAASPSQPLSQMYVCASRTEMSSMAKTMQEVYWGLKNGGFSDEQIRVVLRNRGTHSEAFWAREFKPMYEWLFP